MTTEERINALISSQALVTVTWNYLGTSTEAQQVGRFTELSNGVAQLTSKLFDGSPDPTLILDLSWITNIAEACPAC